MISQSFIDNISALANASVAVFSQDGSVILRSSGTNQPAITAVPVIYTSSCLVRVDFRLYAVIKSAEYTVVCGSLDDDKAKAAASLLWEGVHSSPCPPEYLLLPDSSAELSSYIFTEQETETSHNPYSQARREQESIRSGNIEELKRCWGEKYHGKIGSLADNPLRNVKNLAVAVITLSSRSAIEGGLNAEEVFSMTDFFIRRTERLSDPEAVVAAIHSAQLFFAEKVSSNKQPQSYNPTINKAKDYIFHHLHSKISTDEIAQYAGIHPNYLSALFHRVEGKTLTQYILDEKLAMCENMLKYSQYSIQEISAYFAFCSQSHFTSLFKKRTGLTPRQYRNIYGKENFRE